jgi:hypothetical protein
MEHHGDWPELELDDSFEPKRIEAPFGFAGEGVGSLVLNAVNAMGGSGSDAESHYQRALTSVRDSADEVVRLIASREGFASVPEEHYVARWSLVQLLADLESPATVGLLAEILGAPIPEERSKDPHSVSTVAEEVMIRTTAVDGLERLGRQGVDEARELLLRYVEHEQFSVRRACAQALVAIGNRDDLGRLGERLRARDEAWLLDVRRTDVRQVSQAEGGLFLTRPDEGGRDHVGEVPILEEDSDRIPGLKAVLAKARVLAGHVLEVDEKDIVQLPDGRFGTPDAPETALTIWELAEIAVDHERLPEGMQPGLGPNEDDDGERPRKD